MKMEKLVSEFLGNRDNFENGEIEKYEAEIDELVYHMYGLTEEEIGVVEGGL